MSLFISTMTLFYVILFLISLCSFTFATPTESPGVTVVTKDYNSHQYTMTALLQLDGMYYIDEGQNKTRVKRNSGGGNKFSDAASMSPMKVLQLFFAIIGNIFSSDPTGGVHPMSRQVPKPVVQLFKETIISKFFPELSPDH